MTAETKRDTTAAPAASALWEYWLDRWQRGILFWDVMRRRGNQSIEHWQQGKPPVLVFDHETVIDGRTLERPVNYALLRIKPRADTPVDPAKLPFVVVDPRAGHGPGIGGFKEASQVGVAMRAGHPVYFVSFFPEPVPGQTIEDVARAEAVFLAKVAELHPEADGKPVVIGNCQAGWAIMILAAAAPELPGIVCVAGSPLSYWAGTRGRHPLRYLGGLMGGSWPASLAGDLGHGKFDGAHLVGNFEQLNPANTLWSKQYNLFAKVDTEAERYLEFERWWGGHFFLTAEEIRFIVDELFVGNKLTEGVIQGSERRRIDLKRIRSPIVVIASWGDNITPPPQALNWIADLYESVDEIKANEQTIVYTLHESVGHLGIFVSAKVALKQHKEFIGTVDIIRSLPPGLYEMLIEEQHVEEAGTARQHDAYTVRFAERTIDDILALDDGREDERAFATADRISEINEGLYNVLVQPWVKAGTNELMAEWLRLCHPDRVQRLILSDLNPAMAWVKQAAEQVRANRQPASDDNAVVAAERAMSERIVEGLDAYQLARDRAVESTFYAIYENPVVEALAGLRAAYADERKPRARDTALEELLERKIEALEQRIHAGSFVEAVVRIVLAGVNATRMIDANGVRLMRAIVQRHPKFAALSRGELLEIAREQAFMVQFAGDRALEALGSLLPTQAERLEAIELVRAFVRERGELRPEVQAVLDRVEQILGLSSAGADVHVLESREDRLVGRRASATTRTRSKASS